MGVQSWTRTLRRGLEALGMAHEKVEQWTTHCCRRGAAADILHRQGLTQEGGFEAMLTAADWSSARGAYPYTPVDEIEQELIGDVIIDGLD